MGPSTKERIVSNHAVFWEDVMWAIERDSDGHLPVSLDDLEETPSTLAREDSDNIIELYAPRAAKAVTLRRSARI